MTPWDRNAAEAGVTAAAVCGVVAFGVFRAFKSGEGTEAQKALWSDPRHWRGGVFYSCKEDERAWVPKRPVSLRLFGHHCDVGGMGWTVNFAQREGPLWLASLAGTLVAFSAVLHRAKPSRK